MNSKTMMLAVVSAIALSPLAVLSQQTNKWANSTANTPDTAYDWTVGDHWNTKFSPVEGSYVEIKPSAP